MKIVVTGGAGYIGSHLVNELLKLKHTVLVVDIFLESRQNIIKNDLVKYLEIDIRDKESLQNLFLDFRPDVVFHFAAKASVPDSMSNPKEYYETNVIGGFNLLEAMLKSQTSKIVFSSSASIYGEPETEEIEEGHTKNPTNTYGYTKLVFEKMLQDYYRAYGISSVSFRYFCAAGCDVTSGLGENHANETHVIPCILETILGKREEFFVYGSDFNTKDGTGIRDYIHVSDLASAHIKAMDLLFNKNRICEAFNLGINKGFSVMELIKACEKVSKQNLKFSVRDKRSGDPSRLIANSSKAQKELGWTPKFLDIEEIIETSYFYLKNK